MNQSTQCVGVLRRASYEPAERSFRGLLLSVRFLGQVACGLSVAAATLTSCTDDRARREESELRADPPVATATTSPDAPAETVSDQPTGPLSGMGSRYRVAVGTAYFFDKPEQSTPSGRYLRRGDVFYGEGETNGFVKTGYVQPNGSAGTAWLKLRELTKLTGSAAGGAPRATTAPRAAPRPAAPKAPAAEGYESTPATSPPAASATAPASNQAVVQADRAYFYDSPDMAVPRKAYCERGDKVRIIDRRENAVYVTFTNWEKVTTKGWMRKDALDLGR